jgi:hypothetical protein
MQQAAMSFTQMLDLLRGRVVRHKRGRPLAEVAKDIGLGVDVVARFLRGGGLKTSQAEILEAWCGQQDAQTSVPTPPA